jgi:hypothetical protein
MHRRRFTQLLGCAALSPLWACRGADEPDDRALARLLGLEGAETAWLERLTADERRELREAVENPGDARTARAVALAFSLIGTRSRTFAFAGYPVVEDRRSVCDGLLAE